MSRGLAIGAITALLVLSACEKSDEPLPAPSMSQPHVPSRADAERVVAQYVRALEAGDVEAILSLVSPRVDARDEVRQKLSQFGNRQITSYSTQIAEPFGGIFEVALSGLFEGGERFSDELTLVAERDGLFLSLGSTGSPGPTLQPGGDSEGSPKS